MYRESLVDLTLNAPFAALKVFLNLASKQEFDDEIITTKQAIADELKISYVSIMKAFKWLKENNYIKERKINGQTQFLLNSPVTTCEKKSPISPLPMLSTNKKQLQQVFLSALDFQVAPAV